MPENFHGVRVIEVSDGPRLIRVLNTSIVGFVATADDADADAFPLDTPVLVTNTARVVADAGTSGTLSKTLNAITDQGGAVCVVVRVAEATDEAAQDTLVIGSDDGSNKTGLQALLNAEAVVGVQPRIIGAPDLDTLPVAGELAILAKSLRAYVYIYANGAETKEQAVLYRQNFNQRELMVLWPNTAQHSSVAMALGLRSRIDREVGYHKTISNVPLGGVLSLPEGKEISYNNAGENSDAQFLNDGDVTTLINRNGFRFWGNRTASDDPKFAFESAVRTSQIIADTVANAHIIFTDGGLTPAYATDIVEGVRTFLRGQTDAARILGADVWLDPDDNPKDDISAGKLIIDYDFTPVPPLEQLSLRQRITDRFAVGFEA